MTALSRAAESTAAASFGDSHAASTSHLLSDALEPGAPAAAPLDGSGLPPLLGSHTPATEWRRSMFTSCNLSSFLTSCHLAENGCSPLGAFTGSSLIDSPHSARDPSISPA